MPDALVLGLVVTVPASLGRLWRIWWLSGCVGCGLPHKDGH